MSEPDERCTICQGEMPEGSRTMLPGAASYGAVCSVICMAAMVNRRLGGFCVRCRKGIEAAGRHGFCDECFKPYETKVQ